MSRPTRRRDQFYADMGREGINAEISRRFLRVAATMQRLAEAQCNGDYPCDNGERPTVLCPECQSGYAKAAIRKDGRCVSCHTNDKARDIVAQWLTRWTCELQGDPRGYVLKLITPKGREIGVP